MKPINAATARLIRAPRSRSPEPGQRAPTRGGSARRRTRRRRETDPAAPGDERERRHPAVVGEARQRAEHPEQRRRDDDDREAADGRAGGDIRRGASAVLRGSTTVGVGADDGIIAMVGPPSRGAPGLRPTDPGLSSVAASAAACSSTASSAAAASASAPAGSCLDPPDRDRRERHPDLVEDLDRHEEAGEQEQHAEELAELEPLGVPEPIERVPERRHERADRDQDRRRDAAVELARDERPGRARQRGDEVDRDRARR